MRVEEPMLFARGADTTRARLIKSKYVYKLFARNIGEKLYLISLYVDDILIAGSGQISICRR
jgi:hypothetical protein